MSSILPCPCLLCGGGGSGRGRGVGGRGIRGRGRGHFIQSAMYCTAIWCFALKGLRTITESFAHRRKGTWFCRCSHTPSRTVSPPSCSAPGSNPTIQVSAENSAVTCWEQRTRKTLIRLWFVEKALSFLQSWMNKKKPEIWRRKRNKKLDMLCVAVLHLRLCDPAAAEAALASIKTVPGGASVETTPAVRGRQGVQTFPRPSQNVSRGLVEWGPYQQLQMCDGFYFMFGECSCTLLFHTTARSGLQLRREPRNAARRLHSFFTFGTGRPPLLQTS